MFALPLMIETPYVLKLWLNVVPEHTVVFARLSLISSMIMLLGNTGYTACMATGNIKRYVIWITLVGIFVFPLTWIAYACGLPVEYAYIIYILVYVSVDITRLYIMKGLLQFPMKMFLKDVILPISLTTIAGSIIPLLVVLQMQESFFRLLVTCIICVLSVGLAVCFVALTKHEREMTLGKLIQKLKR